ncbi:hypothetical protein [Myceligenerans halotolerans]
MRSQPGVEEGRVGEVRSAEPVSALDRGGQVDHDYGPQDADEVDAVVSVVEESIAFARGA